jgi:tetratricopeptide (TPR) repeat protein
MEHEQIMSNKKHELEQLNKEISFLYYETSKLWFDGQNFLEAIFCLDKAIIKNETEASFYYHKGLALIELNRFDEAVQCLREAPEKCGDSFLWHSSCFFFSEGYALYRLNKFEDAIRCFEKTEDIDEPDSQSFIWRNLSFFKLNIARAG